MKHVGPIRQHEQLGVRADENIRTPALLAQGARLREAPERIASRTENLAFEIIHSRTVSTFEIIHFHGRTGTGGGGRRLWFSANNARMVFNNDVLPHPLRPRIRTCCPRSIRPTPLEPENSCVSDVDILIGSDEDLIGGADISLTFFAISRRPRRGRQGKHANLLCRNDLLRVQFAETPLTPLLLLSGEGHRRDQGPRLAQNQHKDDIHLWGAVVVIRKTEHHLLSPILILDMIYYQPYCGKEPGQQQEPSANYRNYRPRIHDNRHDIADVSVALDSRTVATLCLGTTPLYHNKPEQFLLPPTPLDSRQRPSRRRAI